MKNIFLALLIAVFGVGFTACSKSEESKGPMEKAGKAVDQAMEKAGEGLKGAGEKMKEAAEKAKK